MKPSRSFRSRRHLVAIACAIGALLAAPRASRAQTTPTIVGSLANFDAVNDTEGEKHGFEIQLEGLQVNDISRVFGQAGATCYIRYCIGSITPYGTPGVPPFGVYVRWTANYDAAAQAFTTPANAPGGGTGTPSRIGNPHPMPATGESCWSIGAGSAYAGSGCEHFGVSTLRNPTQTTYRWLVGDPTTGVIAPATTVVGGVTVPAPPVAIQHPVVAVVAVAGHQEVQAVIKGGPPPAGGLLPRRYGQAQWVKVYKTELPRQADLDELVGGHPNDVVPNAQKGPAETEWKLLQFDVTNPDNGASMLRNSGSPNNGSHSVLRRYEFYKYVGPLVPPGGTSNSKKGGPVYSTDGQEASLCPRTVPGDITTECLSPGPDEVGDFIGAQMAAQNLDGGATVTLDAASGNAGGSVTATITGGPGTAGDWAGLFDALGNCYQWQYLNGLQTLPASGVTSATLSFRLPATAGTYHVRLFNATYTWVGTSGTITTASPILSLDTATAVAGGTVIATISKGPGTPGDWVGLFDTNGRPVQWRYLNGTQTLPAQGVSSASIELTLPATSGTYHARLFNASYIQVAVSGTVTTTAPVVTLGAATGTAGGLVTATITDAPGSRGDWIGLYDANGTPVQWQYLNGSHSMPGNGSSGATVTFVLPATPGTYHARLFNGNYTQVAASGTIVTSAPSVTLDTASGAAGSTVTATIANAPGTTGDWAGLYDANGNPVQWLYLNGSHTLPASGVNAAVLTFTLPAAGVYHVRLFNGIYVLVAASGTVTAF